MAVTTLIAPGPSPKGTFTSAGVDLGSSASQRTLVLHILSNDWTTGESGLLVSFEIDVSTDGQITWNPAVIGTTQGGLVNGRTGGLPSVSVPLPENVDVWVRAAATLNQAANSIGLGYEVI